MEEEKMKEREKKEKKSLDKEAFDRHKGQDSQFSEEIELLRVSLPYIGTEEACNNIKRVIDFFNQNINVHFAYEEQNLFNIVLMIGELEIKQIVRELQQEHIIILSKYDQLKDIVLKHGFSFQDEKIKEDFVRLSKEMIELTLRHARKEDEKLFPWVESKGINMRVDFKE